MEKIKQDIARIYTGYMTNRIERAADVIVYGSMLIMLKNLENRMHKATGNALNLADRALLKSTFTVASLMCDNDLCLSQCDDTPEIETMMETNRKETNEYFEIIKKIKDHLTNTQEQIKKMDDFTNKLEIKKDIIENAKEDYADAICMAKSINEAAARNRVKVLYKDELNDINYYVKYTAIELEGIVDVEKIEPREDYITNMMLVYK